MNAGTPRAWMIAVALVAALLFVLVLYRWAGNQNLPAVSSPLAASKPSATVSGREQVAAMAPPSPVVSSGSARDLPSPTAALQAEGSPQGRPTPAVFDLATLTGSPPSEQSAKDEERFVTNERFTQEDLLHPERYFERAEQMPELNRPEERRDTLAYFLAYRQKLQRDLEAVDDNSGKRQEILTTIARYDSAIARLRGLIDAKGAK